MQQFIDTLINGPSRFLMTQDLDPVTRAVLALAAYALMVLAGWGILYLLFKSFQYTRTFFSALLRRIGVGKHEDEYIFLQLIFPSDTTKSAYATEQLHILMRSMVRYRGFWDRMAARKQPYSLELVATRDEGIRYIIRIPKYEIETIKQTLLSFLPGLKIAEVEDYLPETADLSWSITELKLSGDFVLPLANHKTLEEHDPIAYITGYMRSLLPDELVAFQIVAVPVFDNTHPNELRHIRDAQHQIALNKEIAPKLTAYKINVRRILLRTVFAPLWLIWLVFKSIVFSSSDKRSAGNPYEQELGKTIKAKLDQPLFEVTVRILAISPEAGDTVRSRVNALVSSFSTFSTTNQSIDNRKKFPFTSAEKWLVRYRKRELLRHIASQQTILSSTELSDLYHLPNTNLTKTEGLVKSRSRELAAPLSIKHSETKLDVVVGVNQHGGEDQLIGMTLKQRQKHTYVIGKTGTGKTTLLTSSIYQDMVNGKGLAVLDPHGDMFQELLSIIPEHRQKDVIVFDPSDDEYPIGLNILDPGIEFKSESVKRQKITSSVLSVFKKLADESHWGPRMEHILTNTTLTALSLPNPNLYTLQRLLTEKKYQKSVAKNLKDPVLKQFWEKEFALLGEIQLSTVTAPLTHRLGHFITTEMSRHILLQPTSGIRIADIMNEGKILLANLSKGDIGEDQSRFFGTILTSFVWMAAYQRTKIPEKKRRDFFLYVDEFQNFASPDFSDIVSEGRKYHVSLVVSHQSIAQIEDKNLVKLIAGNASTLICLKVSPEDETFILPYMKPEVERGDIVNLAPYHFYIKTTSDVSEDAFSGLTMPLDTEDIEDTKQEVVRQSRKQYATPKAQVEKYMEEMFGTDEAESSKKPRVTRRRAQKSVDRKDGDSKGLQGG